MSSKEILNDIINNFEPSKFVKFFREKSRKFKPLEQSLSNYNNEDFTNGTILGVISLDDSTEFIIYNFKVIKPLSERSGKKAQYILGKKILKEAARYVGGIFIFYDDKGDFRFSLIYDIPLTNGRRDWSNFKRFTFYLSKYQTNKTFISRLDGADFSLLEKIKEAFSVEKVTKEFYTEIANWYSWAVDKVVFPNDADEDLAIEQRNSKNIIRLLTRIIFIWFMKEKKLIPPSLFEKQTIDQLLNYKDKTGSTYYKAILQNLFFATLNTPMKKAEIKSRVFVEDAEKRGYISDGYMQHGFYRYSRFIKNEKLFFELFNNIPFLNGGLFECLDKKVDAKEIRYDCFSNNPKNETKLKIPDELFFLEEETDLSNHLGAGKNKNVKGLLTILKSYNFTIDENTPVDEEVALDPELLGKVFENLLASYNPETATTVRKATGSYYTPREIVEYMVNESLVEYLKTKMGNENNVNENKIRSLLDYNKDSNPFKDDPVITLNLIDAIENIKILDPACGSGAFPMGLLHKLVLALHKLDPDNSIWKKRLFDRMQVEIRAENERLLQNKSLDYIRKLGLIERCIYGVDIQEIAIQITKLRFFISLLVEQQIDDSKDNRDVRPLPNLETKFVAANTLIGLGKLPEELIDTEVTNLGRKLFALREEIFYSNSRYQKQTLEENEEKLRGQIEQALQDKFHKVINVKINKLEMEADELNKTLLYLRNQPEEIETIVTTNLFGEKETKKVYKIREKINNLTRRLNDYYKQIEELKNPKSDTSTAIAHKIASWNPFDQNTHAGWFDPEWMFGPDVKNGFDVVIGNPPYIGIKGLPSTEVRLYFSIFKTTENRINLYAIFIEKGISLLSSNGILTFINPNSILINESYKKIRKYLIDGIDKILKLPDSVFEAATVETMILFSKKKSESKCVQGVYFTNDAIIDFQNLNFDYFSREEWKNDPDSRFNIFVNKDINAVVGKIEKSNIPLEQFIDTSLGITPYDKYKGHSQKLIKNRQYHSTKKLSKEYVPLISGKNIHHYFISDEVGEYLKYGNWLGAPRDKKFFEDPKIIVRQILAGNELRIVAGYSEKPHYFTQIGFSLISKTNNVDSLKYIVCLLNSKLISFYHKHKFLDTEKVVFQKILIANCRKFPIKESKNKKTFISLFDQIFSKKQKKIQLNTQQLEDQIDIMVYKLYNLTYEEVKIIDPDIEKIISEKDYEKFEINGN